MNLAYFRKSTFDYEKTVENAILKAKELGFTTIGQTELQNKNGTILNICNPTWMGNLIATDKNLIGLLPCSMVILKNNNDVVVGVGSPAILGGVSELPSVNKIASLANDKLVELVNLTAGVGPLKATEVKLYSTMTCPYCKMEASWLDEKKIKYEEVHVDLNQEEAEKMVKKTGQMGVPVTEIKYDNGEEEFIIGFDKARLSSILQV